MYLTLCAGLGLPLGHKFHGQCIFLQKRITKTHEACAQVSIFTPV